MEETEQPMLDKWTIRFMKQLKKPYDGSPRSAANTWQNSFKAQEKIGLPSALWLELSEESEEIDLDWHSEVSLFMAGVAVGWNEATKKAKHGLDEQKP